jgi:hypothetical protein
MEDKNFPTMIIPNGTEISVNEQGLLSIRTPGNLVLQNSGVYSVIESVRGSVRIDPEVKVEAISLQAADSCFVAGELTSWRVKAKKITLEKGAQANIMLQESEALELDRNARLVGNFASEKELYLMLGRFSKQLQNLPEGLTSGPSDSHRLSAAASASTSMPSLATQEPAAAQPASAATDEPYVAPDGEDEPGFSKRQQVQEVLSLVRVVLERELGRASVVDPGRAALERLLELVRAGKLAALNESYLYLISQVSEPSEDLENARDMLTGMLRALQQKKT